MKILISTFGGSDYTKVISAMRSLPYERLVLVGDPSVEGSDGLNLLKRLEEASGHDLEFEPIDTSDFMEAVDETSDVLANHAKDRITGAPNQVVLNISGGSKILGDAALFSAFRLGVEAFHCDERITRLPVLRGATVFDRFTSSQTKYLMSIEDGGMLFEVLLEALQPSSRQAVERTTRLLVKEGLIETGLRFGKVHVSLSAEGREVVHSLRMIVPSPTNHASK